MKRRVSILMFDSLCREPDPRNSEQRTMYKDYLFVSLVKHLSEEWKKEGSPESNQGWS